MWKKEKRHMLCEHMSCLTLNGCAPRRPLDRHRVAQKISSAVWSNHGRTMEQLLLVVCTASRIPVHRVNSVIITAVRMRTSLVIQAEKPQQRENPILFNKAVSGRERAAAAELVYTLYKYRCIFSLAVSIFVEEGLSKRHKKNGCPSSPFPHH